MYDLWLYVYVIRRWFHLLSAEAISRLLDLGDKLDRCWAFDADDPVQQVEVHHAMQIMQDRIQCRLCFDKAVGMVLLPCAHVVCDSCRAHLFAGRRPVCCPFCRQCVECAMQFFWAYEGAPIDVESVDIDN